MKRRAFDFFGEILLEVRGSGGRSTSQFDAMYDQFRVEDPDRSPDVVVERTTEKPELEVVLGDPNDHFGWTGQRFVVQGMAGFMAVDPGWRHIYVSPDWEPFLATYPVEFFIRQRLVEKDEALIHASGVEYDGQTTLFPAWRGAGKTNTLLSLLRAGGNFLSDDRLWMSADGSVRGYPLGVNLQPHNVESFPETDKALDDPREHLRRTIGEKIDQLVSGRSSFPAKGVEYLNNNYVLPAERSFIDVASLYDSADFVPESSVNQMVLLQAAPQNNEVSVEEISAEAALSDLKAINQFEWNGQLMEYFHAYDSLVPDGSAVESLNYVIDQERRVLRTVLQDINTYRASIPRITDWSSAGLDQQIVNTVDSFRSGNKLVTK